MNAREDKPPARMFLTLGAPLKHTLWMFAPPPDMTDQEARRRARWVLLIGVVLMALVVGVMKALMRTPEPPFSKQTLATLIIFMCGVPYTLVPASLFRIIFGVPRPGAGFFNKVLRACAALATFFFTSLGSLVVLGQLSG